MASRSPGRAPDPRKKLSRDSIIKVAAELFNKGGYQATSLAEVADRLGVTRPALYYYYPSKEDLLLDIHQLAQSQLIDSAERIKQSKPDSLTLLAQLIWNHARIVAENAVIVGVMYQEEHSLPGEKLGVLRSNRKAYTLDFEAALRQAHSEGHIDRDVDLQLLTYLILGSCNWTVHWYRRDGWTPEQIATTLTDMTLRGVLSEGGQQLARKSGLLPVDPSEA